MENEITYTNNQPTRILHVIGIMNRGGAETMIMNIYRHIDRSKMQFDFVEHTDQEASFDQEINQMGGKIYHCPRCNCTSVSVYRKWWKEFFYSHNGEYSLVHGHIGSTAVIYLAEAKKAGLYTIAHSHNTNAHISIKSMLYRAMSYRTRFVADYYFGCSMAAGKDRYGTRIVEGNHFALLHNAIDVSKYSYDPLIRSEVRKELDLQPKELLIGHVGRFEEQKNHRFLIHCFALLSQKLKNVRLLLVGNGSLEHEIREQIESAGLQEHVILAGVRNDVDRLLQAMDIFVFPSFYEGLPVTLVEAQASGLPCVISDKITDETVLVEELVKKESLENNPEIWCRDIIEMSKKERLDCSNVVAEKGYDVRKTAHWLEEFYLDKAR